MKNKMYIGEIALDLKNSRLAKAVYNETIVKTMNKVHSEIPSFKVDQKIKAAVDTREEVYEGVNYNRAVIYLTSNGCEWAVKSGNGCTMCGHLVKQLRTEELINEKVYFNQFEEEYEKIDFEKKPILNLYNNGSFFNDKEISVNTRRKIMKLIGKNNKIKLLVLESRPEYITQAALDEVHKYMANINVEIAMGLEVKDDNIRLLCINKGFTRQTYQKAAKKIVECQYDNINLRTYVLLKPVFLTEQEAINEAISTIKYAFSLGCKTVSLEGCTIQDYTLNNYMSDRGAYSTPWIWSIIEVVKNTYHYGKLIIGMFDFYPSASKVPYNCDLCSERVKESLREYNRSLNISAFSNLTCSCIKKWEQEKLIKLESLNERVVSMLK